MIPGADTFDPQITARPQSRPRDPTMVAAAVAPLVAFAMARGMSAETMETEAGLSPVDVLAPDDRIPEIACAKLWQAVQRQSPREAIVIEFVRSAPLTSIAGMAYSARYASNVRQIFELIIRNQDVASEGCDLSLLEDGDQAHFVVSHALGQEARLIMVCLLGIVWRTLTEVLELDLQARSVDLHGLDGTCMDAYRAFFGTEVRTEASRFALTVDRDALDIPSKHYNEELLAFSETFFAMTLGEPQHEDAEFTALLNAVAKSVSEANFAMGAVANHTGWSPRKAQRVASRQGTTVAELLRDARFSRVKHLLLDTQVSLIEAAYFAGYSDDRAFRRAFKAKFGVSPSEYRRKLG